MSPKANEVVEICKNCRFHSPGESRNINLCRRYAPHANSSSYSHWETEWPKVLDNDWCGEFEPFPEE